MRPRVSKMRGGANENDHCSTIIGWETGYVRMAVAALAVSMQTSLLCYMLHCQRLELDLHRTLISLSSL